MASYQYIYVMKQLDKVFPGGRELLKNITLSFLPGAKIGVLGVNGAGKSTLLKIMAGIETEFNGEAWAAEGATVGFMSQEPELDPSKDVEGNVMEGAGEVKELLDRFNEVSNKFAEPMDPFAQPGDRPRRDRRQRRNRAYRSAGGCPAGDRQDR